MYYVMYKEFAQPILDNHPEAAQYDNQALVLTGTMPKNFTGEINHLHELGFNESGDSEQVGLSPVELTAIVDGLRLQEPNEMLAMISKPQGKWLYKNHEAFMPTIEE